ncbi:hypothetical protein GQX74_002353 [Glossina fuscipes]|nr:hypothetical protein GQX74_002353 [Glossina fuscipes]
MAKPNEPTLIPGNVEFLTQERRVVTEKCSFVTDAVLVLCAVVQAAEKSDCSLPKEIGPCRASYLKFYYNSGTKACNEFFYGGCQGNANRFDTKEECENLCF